MRLLLLASTLVLVTGCVKVHKAVMNDRSNAPVAPEDVYLFLADDEIPEDCERVALLHGSGAQEWTSEGKMWDKLREEAGKLGANAVHIQEMEDAGTGERIAAGLFGTQADRDAEAIALFCPTTTEEDDES